MFYYLLILSGADVFNFLHILYIINEFALLLLLLGRFTVVIVVAVAPISLRDSSDGRQGSTDVD